MFEHESRRERLKAALRLARYRVAHHTSETLVTHPPGSEERYVLGETVSLPVSDVYLLINAATRDLAIN